MSGSNYVSLDVLCKFRCGVSKDLHGFVPRESFGVCQHSPTAKCSDPVRGTAEPLHLHSHAASGQWSADSTLRSGFDTAIHAFEPLFPEELSSP